MERHSNAKLQLLELYLTNYFDTVVVNPRQDSLSISLVDGFSGGGKYLDRDGSERAGSPFVLLRAVEEAQERLNRNRLKPLTIEPRFYFVDSDRGAIEYLRTELQKDGYADAMIAGDIVLRYEQFEAAAPTILADIKQRHHRGRSLFVLDQKGWSGVQFLTIRAILDQLPRAEVILTFAVDWLMAYMNDGLEFRLAMERAGFSQLQVAEYLKARGQSGYRYLIPRLLKRDIQELTGAAFFSAFFLKSATAGRDLWVIHLSKITTARNVMVASHWEIGNADTLGSSIHQGPAGLKMLGFDPDWEDTTPLDFGFDRTARGAMAASLLEELPRAISEIDNGDPATLDFLLAQLANHTAATKAQLESALVELHEAHEIDILAPGGSRKRGATLTKIDRVSLPRQRKLFTF